MKVKNQHYVPRFYLNFFSNNSKLWCFDKTNSKNFETNINKIASEKYFYDDALIDQLTGEQTLEKTLSEMENDLAPRLKKFISKVYKNQDNFSLEEHDKITLSELFVMQMFRTPESKNSLLQVQNLYTEKLPHLIQKQRGLNLAENHSLFLLKTLQNEETYIEMFKKIWIVYTLEDDNLFYTSDSPVCGYVHNEISFDAYEIFMPLTPKIIISALARKPFKSFEKLEGSLTVLKDYKNIAFYNEKTIINSSRFIYGNNGDFNLVNQMLTQFPELKNPSRLRFNII